MSDTRRAIYPSLAGKVTFITGGGSGIGAAYTRAFAAQNSRVAFIDIAEEPSRALAEEISATGATKPLFLRCDVCDIEALRATIEQVRAQLGDIAILLNNAASDDRRTFQSVTP